MMDGKEKALSRYLAADGKGNNKVKVSREADCNTAASPLQELNDSRVVWNHTVSLFTRQR